VWRPDRFAGRGLLGRDALDLSGDPVEGARKAHVLALCVVRPRGARLLDGLLRLLEAVAEGLVDVLVRDLDPELVGGGLEDELARNGGGRLVTQASDQILRRVTGHLQVGLERAAAPLENGVELAEQRPRPGVDERTRYLNVRGFDEPVERSASEGLVDLRFDLLSDALLDVGPELGESVELGGRARELVVELWEHLLLDLLHERTDLDRLGLAGLLELDLPRLAGAHACQLLLELRDQPP